MYKIHKEGHWFIASAFLILYGILFALMYFGAPKLLLNLVLLFNLLSLFFIVSFFRIPTTRQMVSNDNNKIIAPADGKVVVIEEVEEKEYFNDKRLQVSIFMSPLNVHVNRNPISGKVAYSKYHPGDYLVAWHPKSSELNERFTTVIKSELDDVEILMRQIAGKLARKISNYVEEGQQVLQSNEFGFIKFGSRVDLFLPLDCNIKVNLNQKVQGGKTVLAEIG